MIMTRGKLQEAHQVVQDANLRESKALSNAIDALFGILDDSSLSYEAREKARIGLVTILAQLD